MEEHWYFAYGSNLAADQKERRTGRIREARRARLDGYRLAFHKMGDDGTGKANVVEEPGATVWGVVYRCHRDAMSRMDKYEGVADGHYARKAVRVCTDDGEELEAVIYVAGTRFVANSLRPSASYLQTILRGAREHDLPAEYVQQIEALGRR